VPSTLRRAGLSWLLLLVAPLVLSLVSPAAFADERPVPPVPTSATTAPPAPKWYDEIAVNGYLEASYSYNFNRPDSGTNQYRVFDFDDNTFKLDVVTLTLQKAVSKPGEAGFRVDFDAGASIPKVSAAYGMFQGQDFDVKQAFVSYVAPLGSGLRVDAGKFLTPFSYEYIQSWDTPNDNATRSFMFGYAMPAMHTGVKSTYAFSDRVSGMVMLVNGWDNVRDNNSSKSVGAQLVWTPTPAVTVTGNFMSGPERTGVNSDPRTVFELIAQWKATDLVVFGLDGVTGSEKGAVVAGETATWSGLTAYARLGLSGTFAFCLRGEVFSDPDGARTGRPQTLREVTLTPEWKLSPHLLLRADLRVDWSTEAVFEKGADWSTTQPTVLVGAAYSF
jgi:hypothetical protein